MQQKPTGAAIANEAANGLKNSRGTLAMARTADPHSATGQFFINLKNNSFLDHTAKTSAAWGYAVFAKVVDGMDVVDAIGASKRDHRDQPTEPTAMRSVKIVD